MTPEDKIRILRSTLEVVTRELSTVDTAISEGRKPMPIKPTIAYAVSTLECLNDSKGEK